MRGAEGVLGAAMRNEKMRKRFMAMITGLSRINGGAVERAMRRPSGAGPSTTRSIPPCARSVGNGLAYPAMHR